MPTNFSVVVREMLLSDIETVCELMRKDPEVAFCPWENGLFETEIDNPDSVLLVAEDTSLGDSKIVGALIGGSFARRGMICHTDVESEYRSHGIGAKLVDHCMEIFRQRELHRVHLILTPGNTRAEKFWKKVGFDLDSSREFLELDIDPSHLDSEALTELCEPDNSNDVSGNGLLSSYDEWGDRQVVDTTCKQRNGLILKHEEEDEVSLLLGGCYGFRAEISHLLRNSKTEQSDNRATRLIEAALCRFANHGALRVQAQFPADDDELRKHLMEHGFHPNHGEKLFHCILD